jgi:Tol biopolymer transport system component
MTDERIDALVRRLDVVDLPPPDFVDDTWLAVRGEAADARRWDRSVLGRLSGWLPAPPTARWRPLSGTPAVVFLVLLLALALWAVVPNAGGRLGHPPDWLATHVLFGRGHHAAAIPGYDLVVVGSDGSGARPLLTGTLDIARVSHDGKRIAVSTIETATNQVVVAFPTILDADGSNPVQLHPDPTLNLGTPAWSRGGDWLAFEAWDEANPNRTGVWLMRPDGSDLHRLTGPGVPGDFSPDDRQLVVSRQEGLFVLNVDGTNEHQIGVFNPTGYSMAGFFPDGRSIYAASDGRIQIVDLSTGATSSIGVPGGNIVQPRLSPDGSQFVFTFDPTAATSTAIWLMNVDGTAAHLLADDPAVNEDFSDWLP